MKPMPVDAYIGFARFGLGLRQGDDAADPRAQLLAEIAEPEVALLTGGKLLDSPAALAAYREFRMEKKAGKAAAAAKTDDAMADESSPDMTSEMAEPAPKPVKNGKLKGRKKKQAAAAAGEGDAQNYNLRVELPVRLERI